MEKQELQPSESSRHPEIPKKTILLAVGGIVLCLVAEYHNKFKLFGDFTLGIRLKDNTSIPANNSDDPPKNTYHFDASESHEEAEEYTLSENQ